MPQLKQYFSSEAPAYYVWAATSSTMFVGRGLDLRSVKQFEQAQAELKQATQYYRDNDIDYRVYTLEQEVTHVRDII